jgi:hypothetical protein
MMSRLHHHRLRAAAATLAAFAALVAVAVARSPAAGQPAGPSSARAALVTSGPAARAVPRAGGARVVARRHAMGGFEAQAEVLQLAAQGYAVVAGEGPAARAAVAQARAAGAFPATRFVAVSPGR